MPKQNRDLLSTYLKEDSKQTYFSYFKKNIKDIKKTCKDIKSMKSKNSHIPSSIIKNGKCITESTTIANIFNVFFILLPLPGPLLFTP